MAKMERLKKISIFANVEFEITINLKL